MKKSKNIKLDFKAELEFSLIGISSHENDYHLSWAINEHLGLKLFKSNKLSVFNKQLDTIQDFSVSSYDDEDTMLLYNLVSNTGEKGFLFSEFRNIDFFLQIYGEIPDLQLTGILEKLKKIDIISASFIIDPETLKSPEKLLFN